MLKRRTIIALAQGWIGAPYRHQAACKGAGCDCLGLLRGLWAELYGQEAEAPPPYTPDWGEAGAAEFLLTAARRHLREIAPGAARGGDVLLFRMQAGRIAKHLAILESETTMIHAVSNACVKRAAYNDYWRRHVVAAFVFPGLSD